MPATPSPLRYPGGKTAIHKMMSSIIYANKLAGGHYAEPYAGGGGLALSLLFNQTIHEIHLNDLDRSIWSFWYSILNHTEKFIKKIMDTPITIDEWHYQKSIQHKKNEADILDLGFSSFFLNRTNRSGIILKAGVIGGLEQKSKYSIDCRFNKNGLIAKILRIKKYRHRINLYNLDAIDFLNMLDEKLPEKSIFCIDPPYFEKGALLYSNFYTPKDHQYVFDAISKIKHPWILTYDNAEAIINLYKSYSCFNYSLNHSAAKTKVGKELLITKRKTIIPKELILNNKLTIRNTLQPKTKE